MTGDLSISEDKSIGKFVNGSRYYITPHKTSGIQSYSSGVGTIPYDDGMVI